MWTSHRCAASQAGSTSRAPLGARVNAMELVPGVQAGREALAPGSFAVLTDRGSLPPQPTAWVARA
jgi:hypothetical protein